MIEYTTKPVLYDIGVKNGTKKNQNSRLCTTSAIKARPDSFGLLTASAVFFWSHANRAYV
jgi:hypothetical protein